MLTLYEKHINTFLPSDAKSSEMFSHIANFYAEIYNVLFINLNTIKNSYVKKHSMRIVEDVSRFDKMEKIISTIKENSFQIDMIFIDCHVLKEPISELFEYVESLGLTSCIMIPMSEYSKIKTTSFIFNLESVSVKLPGKSWESKKTYIHDLQRDEKLNYKELKERWFIDEKIKSLGL